VRTSNAVLTQLKSTRKVFAAYFAPKQTASRLCSGQVALSTVMRTQRCRASNVEIARIASVGTVVDPPLLWRYKREVVSMRRA
jgi:hypothetical protein